MNVLHLKTAVPAETVEICCGERVFDERLPQLTCQYENKLVFTDENVFSLYGNRIRRVLGDVSIHVMSAGEEYKTERTLLALLSDMAKTGLKRTDCLIAIGGGVVGDVGGLAAALYMRGIDFFQVPTTLLAQVDSSVGGKTAIDFYGIKNLVGVFSQPRAVIVDPLFLSTLSLRELRCGLGEMVKHGALSAALFDRLIETKEELFSLEKLKELIFDNIKFKASIVTQDAKERGIRECLNLGHTTAHAFELGLKTMSHGECVLLGMIFEAEIAKVTCLCDLAYLDELIALCRFVLGKFPELPPFAQIARYALFDKKNREANSVALILPVEKGEYRFVSLEYSTYVNMMEEIRRKLC